MGNVIVITDILRANEEQHRWNAEVKRADDEYAELVHDEWLQDITVANALKQIDPENPVEAILLLGDGRFLVGTERFEKY